MLVQREEVSPMPNNETNRTILYAGMQVLCADKRATTGLIFNVQNRLPTESG